MAVSTFLLVPSPLLGPATWEPVAGWLRGQGHAAMVVELGAARATPAEVLEAVVRSADGLQAIVLVPHSNAGLYAPLLSRRLDIKATVFVDAALPGPGPSTPLCPPGLLDRLRELADEKGVLPPWTQWWTEEDLEGVFPDAVSRAAVEAEQPRLPLSYFTATLPVPVGWARASCGYLAFGETYAPERALAGGLQWPVRMIDGAHLHQLHDPAAVGRAVVELATRSGG